MLKTKKTIQKLILASLLVVVAVFSVNLLMSYVIADTVNTSVTVGNSTPTITGNVVESVASTQAAPTDVGLGVTFQGTANDSNGDQYYMIICDATGASPGDDAAPSCTGDAWCTSTATASDAEASCTHTTLIGDAESNAWFAYACDKLATALSPACSTVNQGTGDPGSPFETNHAPAFTVANTDDSTPNPNTLVTWTTIASDPDSSGSDTVSLYVCSTASFTGGASPACGGTELCSQLNQASDPTCGYTSLRPDAAYGAFTYIVDSHGFVSAGVAQAEDNSFTVNNVAPSVAAGTITLKDTDGSGDLTLSTSQGETQNFTVEFIVTDDNSCDSNEISSAVMHARLSSVAQASCDDNGEDDTDSCYAFAQAGTGGSCVQDTSIDDCTGTTDTTVGWKCTFPLNYNTEPTVALSTQAADVWRVAIQATDNNSAASTLTDDTGSVEMGQFLSYAFTAGTPVAYGTVGVGDDSSEQTVTMQSRGNIGLDMELSGGNSGGDGMCVADYPTCAGNKIAIAKQVYNLSAAGGWSGGAALAYSASEVEMNVNKPASGALTPTGNVYMYLQIPAAQGAGLYAGEAVLAGVTSESAGW